MKVVRFIFLKSLKLATQVKRKLPDTPAFLLSTILYGPGQPKNPQCLYRSTATVQVHVTKALFKR